MSGNNQPAPRDKTAACWSGTLQELLDSFRAEGAILPDSADDFRALLLDVQPELRAKGIELRVCEARVEIVEEQKSDALQTL